MSNYALASRSMRRREMGPVMPYRSLCAIR
jgi:hypothetical protein